MGDWHKVELQEDIDFLMETYGGFHDSCIVSLSFQSGAFVDNDMAMHFGSPNERILGIKFVRPFSGYMVKLCARCKILLLC